MTTTTIKFPVKGDQFTAHDFTLFEVTNVFSVGNETEPWVEYTNIKTKQLYTCKQDAFLSRFTYKAP